MGRGLFRSASYPPRASLVVALTVGCVFACGPVEEVRDAEEAPPEDDDVGNVTSAIISPSIGNIVIGNRCLDVNRTTLKITVKDCTGASNQSWAFEPTGELVGLGNQCLTVTNPGVVGGTVQLGPCSEAHLFQWSGRAIQHTNPFAGMMCLAVPANPPANGAAVKMQPCDASSKQFWGLGVPRTRFVGLAGKCMVVAQGNAFEDGAPAVLSACTGGIAERWTIGVEGQIRSTGEKCLVLDSNRFAVLGSCTTNQRWSLSGANVRESTTNTCLDVKGASSADGTRITGFPCKTPEAPNQSWLYDRFVPYQLQVIAFAAADDDGTTHKTTVNQSTVKAQLDLVNADYRMTGIQFELVQPAGVTLKVSSTLVNHEHTLPPISVFKDPRERRHLTGLTSITALPFDLESSTSDTHVSTTTNNMSFPGGAPAPAGELCSYSGLGGEYIFNAYRGASDSHIYSLVGLQNSTGPRLLADVTVVATAPAANGDPVCYSMKDGTTQRIAYVDLMRHVVQLFTGTTTWQKLDLSVAAHVPADAVGKLAAYVSWLDATTERQHIVYRGTDSHLYELWEDGTWHFTDLTQAVSAPLATGAPSAYTSTSGTSETVLFRDASGHVYRIWRSLTSPSWHLEDLHDAVSGSPLAHSSLGDPVGYIARDRPNNSESHHVVYVAADATVREFYWEGLWRTLSPGPNSGAPNAAAPVTAYAADRAANQFIAYVGVDANVHELSRLPGKPWEKRVAWTGGARAMRLSYAGTGDWNAYGHQQAHERFANQYADKIMLLVAWGDLFDNDLGSDKCNADGSACQLRQRLSESFESPFGPLHIASNMQTTATIGHEAGHLFGLGHTFYSQPKTRTEAQQTLDAFVLAHPGDPPEQAFDGDVSTVRDTRPDIGNEIWSSVGVKECSEGAKIDLFALTGEVVTIPARPINIMSYIQCQGTPRYISGEQLDRMRDALHTYQSDLVTEF